MSKQTIDLNHLSLTNSMATSLSLNIILWIPVTVIDNTSICCCEINTDPTRTSGEQKYKLFGVFLAKPIDAGLPLLSCAINETLVTLMERSYTDYLWQVCK